MRGKTDIITAWAREQRGKGAQESSQLQTNLHSTLCPRHQATDIPMALNAAGGH